MSGQQPLRLAVAIALLSAAALAYQLLLMRWLAIAHWQPFAVMIISLALLGHGASGTWLSLWPAAAGRHFGRLFPACATLFAISAVASSWLARRIPFNGLELVWNPSQLLWLSALYLVLALPFFFAASCFGLAFARHGGRIPMLYGADLVGAGLGALAALALAFLPVGRGLVLAALCGPLAAWLVLPTGRGSRWPRALLVLVAMALLALLPDRVLAPPVNEFKGLSKALLLPDARVIAERHGPYGWLALLQSPRVPLRHAPGLSLGNVEEPPPQLGLYTDGDALSAITRRDGRPQRYLGRMTSALPYAMRPAPAAVLVLGAGGGQEVLQALALGAGSVDAVELDPQRLRLVRDHAAFAGDLYRDPRVRTFVAEPRAFVRAGGRRYDLIVLAGDASFAGGGAGVQAAAEHYGLTVQALRDYLARLEPGGLLAITRWRKQPPRDELKLFATAVAALRANGHDDPGARIVAIRNWDASTWLVKRGRFAPDELARLRGFAESHGFDRVHHPGLHAAQANRFHLLDPPYLFEGTRALLSPQASKAYLADYKFAIAPATDDRPYFGNFFRWRSLPELWLLRDQGSAVLLDSGYLLLLATLLQALPLTALLVLLPLLALPRTTAAVAPVLQRGRAGAYFLALGLAFMLVEIASLSRLTLLVGHPLLAVTVGLGGFLLCTGAGSVYAQRLLARAGGSEAGIARRVTRAVVAIALGLGWQFAVFAFAFDAGAGWPVAARALAGLLGIAPLAFAMGLPFALGLSRLARVAPALVPWAWGLNGCASVLAAIGALLLAMAIGLRATLLFALGLYVFAAWVWRAPADRGRAGRL